MPGFGACGCCGTVPACRALQVNKFNCGFQSFTTPSSNRRWLTKHFNRTAHQDWVVPVGIPSSGTYDAVFDATIVIDALTGYYIYTINQNSSSGTQQPDSNVCQPNVVTTTTETQYVSITTFTTGPAGTSCTGTDVTTITMSDELFRTVADGAPNMESIIVGLVEFLGVDLSGVTVNHLMAVKYQYDNGPRVDTAALWPAGDPSTNSGPAPNDSIVISNDVDYGALSETPPIIAQVEYSSGLFTVERATWLSPSVNNCEMDLNLNTSVSTSFAVGQSGSLLESRPILVFPNADDETVVKQYTNQVFFNSTPQPSGLFGPSCT